MTTSQLPKLDSPWGMLFHFLSLKRWRISWQSGIRDELSFWDAYFRTQGLQWRDSYPNRLDPDLPLQPRPAALLPDREEVNILDVGAGPLTYLGKRCPAKRLHITAIDPLAKHYDRILEKYHVSPLVRTQQLAAEEIDRVYQPGQFDLVFARNCIDHAYDPERAIAQMLQVVRSGCYVLLEHRPNEGLSQNYQGLHRWNFSLSPTGDFLIGSKRHVCNLSQKYSNTGSFSCQLITQGNDGEWLITRIRKR
jgi:SAM-dependent methyltransferase